MSRDVRNPQPPRIKKPRPIPTCVYCGQREGVERDHVIASSFFTRPLPANIPTVPACGPCNRGDGDGVGRNMSDDEEYMRDLLCSEYHAQDHAVSRELSKDKAMRSLARQKKLLEQLAATLEPTTIPLGNDQYILNAEQFTFDISRFERVMRKMVKGMHAFHFGGVFPPNYGVIVAPRLMSDMAQTSLLKMLPNNPSIPKFLGKDSAVGYLYAPRVPYEKGHSWLFVFYGFWAFAGYSGPIPAGAADE